MGMSEYTVDPRTPARESNADRRCAVERLTLPE